MCRNVTTSSAGLASCKRTRTIKTWGFRLKVPNQLKLKENDTPVYFKHVLYVLVILNIKQEVRIV